MGRVGECGMELEGLGRLGHGLRSVELTEIVWVDGTYKHCRRPIRATENDTSPDLR